MVKALMGMPQLKGLPKPLMQSIVDIAAGDIRSAINCATLVALQLRQTPRRKADVSMYFPFALQLLTVVWRVLSVEREDLIYSMLQAE